MTGNPENTGKLETLKGPNHPGFVYALCVFSVEMGVRMKAALSDLSFAKIVLEALKSRGQGQGWLRLIIDRSCAVVQGRDDVTGRGSGDKQRDVSDAGKADAAD